MKDEWESSLNLIMEPKVEIHPKIEYICQEIQKEFPNKEFSILTKGEYSTKGFKVSDDYIIPKQSVTSATIDYEDLHKYQEDGYNVVIHSHHKIGNFFSKTDIEYINCNFPCSILFSNNKLTLATLSFLKESSMFFMVTEDIQLLTDTIKGIENIEDKTLKQESTLYPKEPRIYAITPIKQPMLSDDLYEEDPDDFCITCPYKAPDVCLTCATNEEIVDIEDCLDKEMIE